MYSPELDDVSSASENYTDDEIERSFSAPRDSSSDNDVTIIGEVIRTKRLSRSKSVTILDTESSVKSYQNDDSPDNPDEEVEPDPPVAKRKRYKRIVPPKDSDSSSASDSDDSYRYLRSRKQRNSSPASQGSHSESSKASRGGSHRSSGNSSNASCTGASDSESGNDDPIGARTRSRLRLKSESPLSKPRIEFSSGDEDEGSDKSYTSKEESEPEFEGKCVVCKNLERINIRGRSTTQGKSWCSCGKCRHFGYTANDFDLICCREYKDVVNFFTREVALKRTPCITSHPRFPLDVIKIRALKRTERKLNPRVRQPRINPRYDTASKSYVRWIWDRTYCGTRMLIPACVRVQLLKHYDYKPAARVRLANFCANGRRCKIA